MPDLHGLPTSITSTLSNLIHTHRQRHRLTISTSPDRRKRHLSTRLRRSIRLPPRRFAAPSAPNSLRLDEWTSSTNGGALFHLQRLRHRHTCSIQSHRHKLPPPAEIRRSRTIPRLETPLGTISASPGGPVTTPSLFPPMPTTPQHSNAIWRQYSTSVSRCSARATARRAQSSST